MAQCAVIDTAASGVLRASSDDPCTGFVLLSPTEYGLLNNSPLNLSAEDGAAIAVAIVGVWAGAFFWRAAIRALGAGEGNEA